MKFHSLASEKNSQLCQYKNYDFVAILKKWLCIKIQSSFEGAVIIMREKLCEWIIINYLIKREVIIWFQYFLWHLTEKSHSEVQGQWGATLIFTLWFKSKQSGSKLLASNPHLQATVSMFNFVIWLLIYGLHLWGSAIARG